MEYLIHRMLAMGADAAVAAIVLVPLFLYMDKKRWHDMGQTVLYLLLALYLSGMYGAAGLPGVHSLTFRPRMNFTLFEYMFSDYRSSLLNVLFFVPLGFLLPMIWNRFRPLWRTVLFGFGTSLFIETLQLLTPRATDVNDLVTNTVGTIAGFCLARLLQLCVPMLKPNNNSWDLFWICGSVGITMFLIHPLLSFIIF